MSLLLCERCSRLSFFFVRCGELSCRGPEGWAVEIGTSEPTASSGGSQLRMGLEWGRPEEMAPCTPWDVCKQMETGSCPRTWGHRDIRAAVSSQPALRSVLGEGWVGAGQQ